MAPKLSLAMIVKDEEENLANCLASVAAHVDEIVIVDTGSRDRTKQVAVSYGASVHQFDHNNHPEAFFLDDEATCAQFGAPMPYSGEVALGDFAAARNHSFDQATGDFIFWCDADDVVERAEMLRPMVNDLAARNLDFGFLGYDYARDHLGRVFYRQWRERVIRRGTARWVNPVHEVLLPNRSIVPMRYEDVNISHRRKADRGGIPNRNYKILLRQIWQEQTAKPGAPTDPRTLFYLGQEARWIEPVKAVGFYEAYLKTSGWAEERAAAHVALGNIYEMNFVDLPPDERMQRANREYATAAAEMPGNPDGLFGLARVASMRERWQDCVNYSERGFSIGNTESMLGANPLDRLYRPHVYYNYALGKLGRLAEAAESCKKALDVCPDDPGVAGGSSGMVTLNLRIYQSQLAAVPSPQTKEGDMIQFDKNEDVDALAVESIPRDALVIWAMQLWKQVRGDISKERALLDALPAEVALDPVVARMRASTDRRSVPRTPREVLGDARIGSTGMRSPAERVLLSQEKRSANVSGNMEVTMSRADHTRLGNIALYLPEGKLDVVFWVGPAFEPWDATTPTTKGIGGSETACIEVAKNLAALGHRVTVYGDMPGKQARVDDGVSYVHYETFNGIDCDVLVVSRAPAIIEARARIRAKLKLLWVHDIHVGPPTPQMHRWLLAFDRILCLSEWHKSYFASVYPFLHPSTIIVTRNGIDPGRFSKVSAEHAYESWSQGKGAGDTKTNSMVWSSSPNRGLDMLLHNFQFIRQRVPDAELHIFYGFDCWETLARQRGDQNELAQIAQFKHIIAAAVARGGVHDHGRRPQPEVAAAYMRAKVWPYLTSFPETSCITAMEAQAAGCVPVASRVAALAETVKHGVLLDNADAQTPARFVDECVRMMTDEAYRESFAKPGREWALGNLSWSALAKQWSEMFSNLIGQVEANPVQSWAEVR